MRHIDLLGQRLEYRDIPPANPGRPTLLLLHEGLGCVAMWRKFPERLAEATGCRVVAWSRAGYGGSTPYAEARRADYMHREATTALPALLGALGIERPLLVGHSDGASIALIFAGTCPEVPCGIALMAPHEFVEEATLVGIRAACNAWHGTDLPQRLGRYHTDVVRVFSDWSDTWLSPAFHGWNIENYLPKIRCPVLAMQGENDEYATMRQIEVIAEQVQNTELLKIKDCGHSPHKDQEAIVIEALARFTGRIDTARQIGKTRPI